MNNNFVTIKLKSVEMLKKKNCLIHCETVLKKHINLKIHCWYIMIETKFEPNEQEKIFENHAEKLYKMWKQKYAFLFIIY